MENQLSIPNRTQQRRRIARRTILFGGMSMLIPGCVESPVVVNAFNVLRYSVLGFPDAPIKREVIDKLPYASISAKIGNGPRSLLVLWRRDKDELHWLSADRAVIVTRHGRIVKTFGFPDNLKGTQLPEKDPLNKTLHNLKGAVEYSRSLDMDDEIRFGLPMKSVFEVVGPRTISIADLELETILVTERNSAQTINWSYTNHYWVDAFDGFVWKSRQHVSRNFDPIEIEVLKPAS